VSTVFLATAVALALLCGPAGYLLGGHRMAVLRTALTTAARTCGHDRPTGLPNGSQRTVRLLTLAGTAAQQDKPAVRDTARRHYTAGGR